MANSSPTSLFSNSVQRQFRAALENTPTNLKLTKSAYQAALPQLQTDLMIRQNALMQQKRRAIIVFEGWDAAGKGGAIKRLTANWDPRGYKVWPIAAPDIHERARHYLYRFWRRLPENGELAIFDRSWYGRVLVERVEGYCDATAWQRAYDEINGFEKTLIDNGTRIIKFFLHVNVDEQAQRFKDRLLVPHKRWKITPDDFRNREKRGQYVAAIEEMLAKTHKRGAPWVIIPAQQKRFARISILRAVLRWMDRFGLQLEQPLDPQMQAYLDRL